MKHPVETVRVSRQGKDQLVKLRQADWHRELECSLPNGLLRFATRGEGAQCYC